MNMLSGRTSVNDFNQFCSSLDVRTVIAAADERGQALGYEKEVYALAILRALHNGDFGDDTQAIQAAVSTLWRQGYRNGFNAESFNESFQDLFVYW